MPYYSLKQVHEILGGTLSGPEDGFISHLVTDSRGVAYPEASLFFAIKGTRHDGHRFIADLFQLGVRCFVVKHLTDEMMQLSGASFIVVKDTLLALQQLAAENRRSFSGPVVAITGSNGKTVLKEWIYQSIHQDKQVIRSPKSYNSQVGVPLSLWQLDNRYHIAIIEAGISLPGEMEKLEKMIRPDIGIITNIGEPHQENFIDYHHKASEKLKLFAHCKKIIYCSDQKVISEVLGTLEYHGTELFTWSYHYPASLFISGVEQKNAHSLIHALYKQKNIEFEIPFQDEASVENAIQLISFMLVLDYDTSTIRERLLQLAAVAMRLELKQGIHNCSLINDTYNSDMGSLSIALDYLNQQHQHAQKTVILSDILQSGKNGDVLYAEVSDLVVRKNINHFIGIGPDLMRYKSLFPPDSNFYPSTSDFLEHFKKEHFNDATILIKGSRAFEFERILKELEEKVHETVLEINLNAMIHNLNYFRSKLKPGTKIVAMVKAFSYGSGSFEIANLLQFQRVDYLAVAFADEGVSLRESGITMPIMVMNPEKSSFEQIIRYHLEPEIYSFGVLAQFTRTLEHLGETKYPVHIKIDSGMHRLGFITSETAMLISTLQQQDAVLVKSVFSHLAGGDEQQFDAFTAEQVAVFDETSSKILKAFPQRIMRHILNSAGIERFPEHQFDMVRLGIGLYGVSAVNQALVREVSTLKTVILQIKNIPANETVGYSRKFKALQHTRIGILPIGYADGLHRILGNNKGKVLVNNHLAPIIGNICMDMTMIDLTGITAADGDTVTIFGAGYSILEISRQMNTIPYEVLTSISRRVKRVYYQE